MNERQWPDEWLTADKEDLLAVLEMRFGGVPYDVRNSILQIRDPDVLERLILVAANAPDWDAFETEWQQRDGFRIHLSPLPKQGGNSNR
ncbi:MAG: hypothetical protein IRZ10_03625 [Thermoflavifilum sp.]|nr:hypothetical protein [Thermoflavifilum sp.]MCL6513484.1 hypothetical protein [Alicyclobacillus sp.]